MAIENQIGIGQSAHLPQQQEDHIQTTGTGVSTGTQVSETDLYVAQMEGQNLLPPPVPGETQESCLNRMREFGNWVSNKIVEEIGWSKTPGSHSLSSVFNLTDGVPLGVRIAHTNYTAADDIIAHDPARLATTKALEAQTGKPVVWKAIEWAVELGAGAIGTVPLVPYSQLTGGFSGSGLVLFRTLYPYAEGAPESSTRLIANNAFRFPLSAQSASLIPAGAEVEFIGKGKLALNGSVGIFGGLDLSPSILGGGAFASIAGNAVKEYAIAVTALGDNKVRVRVRHLGELGGQLMARLQAGFIFQTGSIMPVIGQGQIKFLFEKYGYHTLEEFVTAWTAVTAEAGIKGKRDTAEIATFEIDLNKPEAAKAYADLTHLHAITAQQLALSADSGVVVTTGLNRSSEFGWQASITAIGQKLLLVQALRQEEHGELNRRDGSMMISRKSAYCEDFSTIVAPKKHIEWQTVSWQDTLTHELKTNFRCVFEKTNRVSSQEEVDAFLRFMHAMGVKPQGEVSVKLDDTSGFKRFFDVDKNPKINLDMYFTKPGIERVSRATHHECMEAFVFAAMEADPRYKDFPVGPTASLTRNIDAKYILEQYFEHERTLKWYHPIDNANFKRDLKERYFVHVGRDLDLDIALFERAEKFADEVIKIANLGNQLDTNGLEQFFTNMGKSKGFDYVETLSALSKVAGRSNVLMHACQIVGGGVKFIGVDEGEEISPKDLMARELG